MTPRKGGKSLSDPAQFRTGRVVRESSTGRLYTVEGRGGGYVALRRHSDGMRFDLKAAWCLHRFEATRAKEETPST